MTEEEDDELKIENVRRPVSFHKIYATNVIGEWTEYDFRIELFNEKMKSKREDEEDEEGEKEDWFYISEAMVIFSPAAVRKLKKVIDEAVKEYEKNKGD